MKSICLFLVGMITSMNLMAQSPVNWNCTVKKTDDKVYEIHLAATIETPWHIYSQTTPEGGPVATTVQFSKNPLVVLNGDVKEVGKLIQKHEEVFGVDVKYYEGSLDLVQVVKLKTKVKTSLSGNISFMVCNDKECLPPRTIPFSVTLK